MSRFGIRKGTNEDVAESISGKRKRKETKKSLLQLKKFSLFSPSQLHYHSVSNGKERLYGIVESLKNMLAYLSEDLSNL